MKTSPENICTHIKQIIKSTTAAPVNNKSPAGFHPQYRAFLRTSTCPLEKMMFFTVNHIFSATPLDIFDNLPQTTLKASPFLEKVLFQRSRGTAVNYWCQEVLSHLEIDRTSVLTQKLARRHDVYPWSHLRP